jgi:hypothetical protein
MESDSSEPLQPRIVNDPSRLVDRMNVGLTRGVDPQLAAVLNAELYGGFHRRVR